MAKSKTRLWLSAALLLSAGACAGAASLPLNHLFARDDTCAPCAGTKPEDGLCCTKNRACNVLAGNTTILCCNEGADCSIISTISCEVKAQNPKGDPDNPIKTTALNGALQRCGGECCPFGYSCLLEQGLNVCRKDKNQNAAPIQSTPTTTTTTTSATETPPSTTSTTSKSANATPSASSGTTASPSEAATTAPAAAVPEDRDNRSPSTASIVGGVVGGMLGLVAVGFAAWLCLGRRTRLKEEEEEELKLTRSTSSFGNIIANPVISKPIASDASTMRTDFNRKSPSMTMTTAASSPATATATAARPGFGPARRSPPRAPYAPSSISESDNSVIGLGGGGGGPRTPPQAHRGYAYRTAEAVQVPPIRRMRNSSVAYGVPGGNPPYGEQGQHQQHREPSLETLKVFADPQTVGRDGGAFENRRLSNFTTFSNLMEQAELGGMNRGEAYVPGSAAATPGRR